MALTLIAKFDVTENSMTPARRSFLMRRELAAERLRKRERLLSLSKQCKLLLPLTDSRHVIDLGGTPDYEGDIRGLVNPDGSVHLWWMDKGTHYERACEFNLFDSDGCEGMHFYVWGGTRLSGLFGQKKQDVRVLIDALTDLKLAIDSDPLDDNELPWGNDDGDFFPTPTPTPEPPEPPFNHEGSNYSKGYVPHYWPSYESAPTTQQEVESIWDTYSKPYDAGKSRTETVHEWEVYTIEGTYVARAGWNGYRNFGGWTEQEAMREATVRNLRAMDLGINCRYTPKKITRKRVVWD